MWVNQRVRVRDVERQADCVEDDDGGDDDDDEQSLMMTINGNIGTGSYDRTKWERERVRVRVQ